MRGERTEVIPRESAIGGNKPILPYGENRALLPGTASFKFSRNLVRRRLF